MVILEAHTANHRHCILLDLKQQNMLINLDDAESRLSLSDDGERCGEMSAASQPLRADISSGSISIRIVDFGVGKHLINSAPSLIPFCRNSRSLTPDHHSFLGG